MKALAARLTQFIDLRDCFVFAGIGLTAYGLALIYAPIGWLFAGLSVAWLGIRA